MQHIATRSASALAMAVAGTFTFAAPAQAITTEGTVQLTKLDFSFSDAASRVDTSSVPTDLSATTYVYDPATHYLIKDTLFDQTLPGFASASNSGTGSAALMSAAATSNGLSASTSSFSPGPTYTDVYADASFTGNIYLAPHSTAIMSADYFASASSTSDQRASSLIFSDGDTTEIAQEGLGGAFPSPGLATQNTGSIVLNFSNDSSSGVTRGFYVAVEMHLNAVGNTVATVPEPTTWALSLLGLCATGAGAWRKRAARTSK